jgi:hypothetical protein
MWVAPENVNPEGLFNLRGAAVAETLFDEVTIALDVEFMKA